MQRKKQLDETTRKTIIKKYEDGKGPTEISCELELNVNTVASVIRLYKITGRVDSIKKRRVRCKKINSAAQDLIVQEIENDVSVTLKTLKTKILDSLDINACTATICNSLKKMNYTLKRTSLIPESRNSNNVIDIRESYCNDYLLASEEKIIFIDEFGVSCSTRTKYGRSIKGTPARKYVRAIRSKNYSICAAIMKSGLKKFIIRDASFNAGSFGEFLIELVNSLYNERILTGRIIMDNASIHKGEQHRTFLESKGFELVFLSRYTPQLNPIEKIFSKWKNNILRSNSGTAEELKSAINKSALCITPEDCAGVFDM